MKVVLLVVLGLVGLCKAQQTAGHGLGRHEQNEELSWVDFKFTDIFETVQESLEITVDFKSRDPDHLITYADHVLKFSSESFPQSFFTLESGGPGTSSYKARVGCRRCFFLTLDHRVYSINNATGPSPDVIQV